MKNVHLEVLIPIILYFVLIYIIGIYAFKLLNKARASKDEEDKGLRGEFMTGGRDTGGFVLAMTLVAT